MNLLTLNQFAVLLWKNFTLKVCKVLTALAFPMMLLLLRAVIHITVAGPYTFTSQPISTLPSFLQNDERWELIYVPSNIDVVKEITENVKRNLNISIKVQGFSSEIEFEKYIKYDYRAHKVLAAIVFDCDFKNRHDPLPLQVKYHLRFAAIQRTIIWPDETGWKTTLLFPNQPSVGPRNPGHQDGGGPGYIREGFLAIQHALDKAIILYHESSARQLFDDISILVQRFPYPAYPDDGLLLLTGSFLPLMFILMFSPTVLSIIRSIVWEKEKRLKFSPSSLVFIWYYLLHILHDVIIVLFDYSFIFVFLMCYAIASIFFGFMVSTFFNKARLAASAGSFIYFVSFFPFNSIAQYYGRINLTMKVAACLSPNIALALGIKLLVKFETKQTGVNWNKIWTPATLEDNLTFGHMMGMLVIDAFLYGLVTWYIEAVFPGQYGMPQPWYFFLMHSYWFSKPRIKIKKEEMNDSVITQNKYFEAEPTGLVAGIKIKHLYKVLFQNVGNKDQWYLELGDKVVINNMSLNLYKGQITILLGQNGAGKTTALSILTGHYPPTRGEVFIDGYDITKNITEIRENLGFCPQGDLLFNDLTLSEHLFFYSMVKNIHQKMSSNEINHILSTFDLLEKRDTFSKSLSGGTKRKLSIIIALLGGSKVVILDEPSSGMDPFSRRATWDILQQFKHDRTILLTTHYMDEADILGDRIAIMVKGTLQCCGSSIFLKKTYGAGYHIVMEREPHCDLGKICAIIESHIPDAILESYLGAELSFILPKEHAHRFEALFNDLEMKKGELGVANFGASITTMEEVFLKWVTMTLKKLNKLPPLKSCISLRTVTERATNAKHIQFVSGVYLLTYWLSALLWDLIYFSIACCFLLVSGVFIYCGLDAFVADFHFLDTMMIFMLYGWSVVPLMYLGSLLFSSSTTAYIKLTLFNYFSTVFIFKVRLSLLSPLVKKNNVYSFGEHGIANFLISSAALGLIFLLLLFCLESTFWNLKNFVFHKIVFNSTGSEVMVMVDPLSLLQYIVCPVVKAVRNISLLVPKYECFGLLGLNGAGKTTTFKMLTGEEITTSGVVLIDGINITENIRKIRSRIGYCPQSDPMLGHMTGREVLIMYARLRGVPEPDIGMYVETFLYSMHMETHADKLVCTYSGGNKGKLNTAIALMGKSSVVFLDEPSTGMDPVARRHMWDTVTGICNSGKAIVISSHSMEECEALCTRLAIMVKGKFKCLGSPRHLKNKFGNIYTLTAKINIGDNEDKLEQFKEFIETNFPGNIDRDHHGIIGYYIPSKGICWGKVFHIMEEAKTLFNLVDYFISQITLEQIFLTFANIDKAKK
uniref:ATP-binding cassette sub-family A member 3-like n=1 Tax=Bos indicus x Bos taurus TaxID=30522 RepID=A0A4W2I3P6_BOBOX